MKDPADFKTVGKEIFSAPQPGEKLPAFKVTSLAGDNKGKELDPITLAGNKPHLLILTDELGAGDEGLYYLIRVVAKIKTTSGPEPHVTAEIQNPTLKQLFDR